MSRAAVTAARLLLAQDVIDHQSAYCNGLILEALGEEGRAPECRPYFNKTLLMRGNFPGLFSGTQYIEFSERAMYCPSGGYLHVAAYKVGRKVSFGLLWSLPQEDGAGCLFRTPEGIEFGVRDEPKVDWFIVGTVVRISKGAGEGAKMGASLLNSKGLRFHTDGSIDWEEDPLKVSEVAA